MKVAVFTPYLPYPPDTGGKIRSYYLLRALTERFDVDLYTAYHGESPSDDDVEALKVHCRQVIPMRLVRPWRLRDRVWRTISPLPRAVHHFRTSDSLKQARQGLREGGYDAIIADEICMTPYAELGTATPRLIIRHKVDFAHYREVARARAWGLEKVLDFVEAVQVRSYGKDKMALYQAYLACSEDDAAQISADTPGVPALVIPNGADLSKFVPSGKSYATGPTLLYVGSMNYFPNIDAMQFFFDKAYSLISQAVPDIRVEIVGHDPPPQVLDLARLSNVDVTGTVPDVWPYYDKATIFIVPLRLGSGTRLKIVEAMAMGLPVVSTAVGAEGLDITPGGNILIADDADSFSASVLELLADSDLRARIARGGQQLAQRYDWMEITKPWADLVEQVVGEWDPGSDMNRIAYLINLYPPYIVGGNEMLAHDIVNALRARGYDVHVLTARGPQLDGIPHVHQVFNYSLEDKADIFQGGKVLSSLGHLRHHVFDPATHSHVRSTLRKLQPDLIIIDNLYMASAAPFLAVRGLRCPVIAQVADRWMIYLLRDLRLLVHTNGGLRQTLLQAYVRLVQPLLWRFGCPDEILSISSFMKRFYVEAGFPAGRITPTYLGVDTSLYRPRREPHTKDNDLEIVFAGQLWEGKGPQILVEALGLLRKREPDLVLRLRLIGEGNEGFKQRLRQELSQSGLEGQTVFDGFLPLELLAERLRKGDIFAFPSVWDEPFSISLVAAMASGIPMIATTTGGTPEALEHGTEGLLIPQEDAEALASTISKLARDPSLRNRLSQAAVSRAHQSWSFDAYIDRLEQHYRNAMERSAGTR